ncbi:alkaline-phosphatase-like protein, partial [Halteromyces radiatus]|uniref:alkaline-phosphatase-like protein n=1 Tax=Halteromyces radiatus TaxID=101107 RepID=UPI00221EDE83
FFFVYNSLIDQGNAIPFTAKATAPTVTMPRIKALTTGTVPSFLDAILNIAESDTSSSLEHHDNWVYQFKHNGNRTIHFFGDDTWMRLFPGLFTKTDGTTSFYVSDTVQVDQNVTRHIESDLSTLDWDAVILHYLGLDHIGHLGGPKSALMYPKQQEMDQAMESIYNIVAEQDVKRMKTDPNAKGTLIVLCGDHGMNDVGNHGGSSIGETSAAMVFISPRFDSRPVIKHATRTKESYEGPPIISQPTDFHFEFAFGYPVIDQVDLVPTLAVLFGLPIPKNNLGKVILDLYGGNRKAPSVLRALQLNAHQLDQLLGNQQCTDGILRHEDYLRNPSPALAMDAVTAYLQFCRARTLYLVLFFTIVAFITWIPKDNSYMVWHLMSLSLILPLILGIRTTLFGMKQVNSIDVSQSAGLIRKLCKIIRVDGIDGVKDASIYYESLLSFELVHRLNQVELGQLIYNYAGACFLLLTAILYVSKHASFMNLDYGRPYLRLILYMTTPLLILLSKPHHAIHFFLFTVQMEGLLAWQRLHGKVPMWVRGFLAVCLCHYGFFVMGRTNSIASIDLSNAYIGVDGYRTVLIGIITFCSNWSGALWWCIAGWVLASDNDSKMNENNLPQTNNNDDDDQWLSYCLIQAMVFSVATAALSISVMVLREHLFIWTVFSPKYLYQIAWTVLFFWFVQIGLGTFLVRYWYVWSNPHQVQCEEDEQHNEVPDDDDESPL